MTRWLPQDHTRHHRNAGGIAGVLKTDVSVETAQLQGQWGAAKGMASGKWQSATLKAVLKDIGSSLSLTLLNTLYFINQGILSKGIHSSILYG